MRVVSNFTPKASLHFYFSILFFSQILSASNMRVNINGHQTFEDEQSLEKRKVALAFWQRHFFMNLDVTTFTPCKMRIVFE